jgi:hypothetical protein
MKRLLVQTQLSNYDREGKFSLECDSGWQMVMGRVREVLKLRPDIYVDVMCPSVEQLITQPETLNGVSDRVQYLRQTVVPDAPVTRFDFDFRRTLTSVSAHKYDAVYINDPMHLRNFRAVFSKLGYTPRFTVHNHFVDCPSCPKFPTELSMWHGQCEAAIRADFNFWQCGSAMRQFFRDMHKDYAGPAVSAAESKSESWDDGYSEEEVRSLDISNILFDVDNFHRRTRGKKLIFVPNRIGGRGRSDDYTNCGKFMFELLPELRRIRHDFAVVAGNPNQKFSNAELEVECGEYGYINLVPATLNRDEYKYIATHSDVVLALYGKDTYGGTAVRECVELGCRPLWLNCNEYADLSAAAGYPFVVSPDFSDFTQVLCALLDRGADTERLLREVRRRCSYSSTTECALLRMGL